MQFSPKYVSTSTSIFDIQFDFELFLGIRNFQLILIFLLKKLEKLIKGSPLIGISVIKKTKDLKRILIKFVNITNIFKLFWVIIITKIVLFILMNWKCNIKFVILCFTKIKCTGKQLHFLFEAQILDSELCSNVLIL